MSDSTNVTVFGEGRYMAIVPISLDPEGDLWIGGVKDVEAGPPGILLRDLEVPERKDLPDSISTACQEYENPDELMTLVLLDGPAIKMAVDVEDDEETWDVCFLQVPWEILEPTSPTGFYRFDPDTYLNAEDFRDEQDHEDLFDCLFVPADPIEFAQSDDALTMAAFLRLWISVIIGEEETEEEASETTAE